jgi:hypothetical protein
MSHNFVVCRPTGQGLGPSGGKDVLRPKECVCDSLSLFMGTASVAFCAMRQSALLDKTPGARRFAGSMHAQTMLAKGATILGLNPRPYLMWRDAWQRILEYTRL